MQLEAEEASSREELSGREKAGGGGEAVAPPQPPHGSATAPVCLFLRQMYRAFNNEMLQQLCIQYMNMHR